MHSFINDLNEQQKAAVCHRGTPLLVLAGAGSGKTRVLTYRIAYLLHQGVAPENILAVTFTNKAAQEMQDRLGQMVGPLARDLWVSTFHSACVRILRRDIRPLGYRQDFTIYDADDQLIVLRSILQELNLDEKKFPPRNLAATISLAKNFLYTPERYVQEASAFYEQKVAIIYRLYQARLKAYNALDFDDLIMATVTLFKENPLILRYYRQRFQHILVDEYQDTNHAQYVLVRLLAGEGEGLCVVGDPDQAIYGWRGADIGNILAFEEDFPNARVILLEENYRSTPYILQAANEVIKHNVGRKEKRLWTRKKSGQPLICYWANDEKDEALFVAEEIYRLHVQEGRGYGSFAVLYRTHAQSRALEEGLMQLNIPYEIIGGLKFYQRREIKDLIAYLRVVLNPADDFSLGRIINVPRRGVGDLTWARLQVLAAERGLPVYYVLPEIDAIPGTSSKTRLAVKELYRFLDTLREQRENITVTECVEIILKETGYQSELEAEKTPEAQARLENLREFLTVTRAYDRREGEKSLEDFLAGLALVTDADQLTGGDKVSLMTLHTAKGLEFPVVFLVGLEEGVFPNFRSQTDQEELEEERRLCYVGMTRAKEKLYLSYARQRTLYGNTVNNPPSRFLKEIPPDLVEFYEAGKRPGPLTDIVKTVETAMPWKEAGQGPKNGGREFTPGDKVKHKKWGVGVIVRVRGVGEDLQLSVAFPEVGIKELLARYAPLEKI
ncbi:MAG: ATP-dependent helicase UvrD/PcrA [Clostridia bacterium]|nr:ATP-dependent helicase UvrD/PcrA [Clostridia bacterium]